MKRIAYTVTATLPDERAADEYVAWLEGGHTDAVVAGGAHSATIVRLDRDGAESSLRVEVRYVFPTREVFDRYLRDHAPALRAEGLKRFPSERKIVFTRSVGEIV